MSDFNEPMFDPQGNMDDLQSFWPAQSSEDDIKVNSYDPKRSLYTPSPCSSYCSTPQLVGIDPRDTVYSSPSTDFDLESSPSLFDEPSSDDFGSFMSPFDSPRASNGYFPSVTSHPTLPSYPNFDYLSQHSYSSEMNTSEEDVELDGDALEGLPYSRLLRRCLLSVRDHRMMLKDIYKWFQGNTNKTQSHGWQNSVRHNLSINGAFTKGEGDAKSSKTVWQLEDFFVLNEVRPSSEYRHPSKRNNLKKRAGNVSSKRQASGKKGGQATSRGRQARLAESMSRSVSRQTSEVPMTDLDMDMMPDLLNDAMMRLPASTMTQSPAAATTEEQKEFGVDMRGTESMGRSDVLALTMQEAGSFPDQWTGADSQLPSLAMGDEWDGNAGEANVDMA